MLLAKKVTIPSKYSDFANVFLKESAIELLKRSDINKNAINPEPGKQPLYSLIYSLGQIKFEILKIYIETSLANNFI